jgi:OOP family OmpA-OmpF porin
MLPSEWKLWDTTTTGRHNQEEAGAVDPIVQRRALPSRAAATAVVTILSCIPIPAAAIEAGFPATATQTASVTEALGSYALPIGPWADGSMLTQRVEGRVVRNAWRIASPGATTLELLSPLRAGIEAEGFRLLYDCVTRDCGGFDFRYGMDVLPEPDMHVDLGDFRYLAAVRGEGAAAEHVACRSCASARRPRNRMSPPRPRRSTARHRAPRKSRRPTPPPEPPRWRPR